VSVSGPLRRIRAQTSCSDTTGVCLCAKLRLWALRCAVCAAANDPPRPRTAVVLLVRRLWQSHGSSSGPLRDGRRGGQPGRARHLESRRPVRCRIQVPTPQTRAALCGSAQT
jgi:hypothetical protein